MWQATFTNVATFNNTGTATVEGTLGVTTLNQLAGTFLNTGTINAVNPVNVMGGTLTTTGAITGGLNNSANVFAQGSIAGGVTNNATGAFVVTGALDNGGGNFTNAGSVSFQTANLTYSNIGSFTNNGTVTIGQYPANTRHAFHAELRQQLVVSAASARSTATMTNNGSIYVGAPNAPVERLQSHHWRDLTALSRDDHRRAVPSSRRPIDSDRHGDSQYDHRQHASPPAVTLDYRHQPRQGSNTSSTRLTVANLNGGAGFVDTPATEAALTNASKGFYIYTFGATPGGQGIRQVPNAGLAAAPLTQVTSTIAALNASFFQNSSAFLGSGGLPLAESAGARRRRVADTQGRRAGGLPDAEPGELRRLEP